MKNILILAGILCTVISCNKAMDGGLGFQNDVIDVDGVNYVTTSTTTSYPRARISLWMMFDSSNYTSDRADYMELSLCDTFNNAVDKNDSVKTVDGSDNLAIRPKVVSTNPLSYKMLVKEQRKFPTTYNKFDTVRLRWWNLNKDHYWFKFVGNNFPATQIAYLWDNFKKKGYMLPNGNQTMWYKVEADEEEKRVSDRFSILLIHEN